MGNAPVSSTKTANGDKPSTDREAACERLSTREFAISPRNLRVRWIWSRLQLACVCGNASRSRAMCRLERSRTLSGRSIAQKTLILLGAQTSGVPGGAERGPRPSISAGVPYPLGCLSCLQTLRQERIFRPGSFITSFAERSKVGEAKLFALRAHCRQDVCAPGKARAISPVPATQSPSPPLQLQHR